MLRTFILGTVLCLISSTMSTEVSRIVSGNEMFGKALYAEASKEKGNLICSPFSAHVVLSMAYAGADGKTSEAFKTVLGLESPEATADEYNALLQNVKGIEHITLNLANKVFIKDGFKLQEPFQNTLLKKYESEAQELNFAKNVESAKVINDWVLEKTNDKIKDLIQPDSLDGLTRLVLVNAVYFKGNWAKKFNKDATREEPFYLADGTETKCQMMHINGKYKYMEDDNLKAKVLEMPYEGDQMSMLIFLPHEKNGIDHLEKSIANFDFANYDRHMNKWEVDISLPRFKIESKVDLTTILKKIGLGEIFSDYANFSRIAKNGEDLKVSEVIQKAFIEVNEEGAEAAAATAIFMGRSAGPKSIGPIQLFHADHPFLISLIHKSPSNKSVMFLGRILSA